MLLNEILNESSSVVTTSSVNENTLVANTLRGMYANRPVRARLCERRGIFT
jgi:hypothetical protein